ncbi:MAG: sodium:solute symporter family protein [Planctomycetota bacterium]
MNFAAVDWVIIVVYLILTFAAGLWMRRYVGKVEDYLVAGREMNVYLGIASLAATEVGIVTVMYTAQNGYLNGFAGAIPGITMAAAMWVVGRTGFVINPLRASGAMTLPELFEKRYSKGVRWFSGVLVATGGILNMGIFLKLGGKFLVAVTGIDKPGAAQEMFHRLHLLPLEKWPLETIMTVLLLGVLIYTSLGGMLSVLVTDYIQFIFLGASIVATSVLVLAHCGWDRIIASAGASLGSGAFNPFLAKDMGIGYVIWQLLTGFACVLTWQTVIARVLASKDPASARKIYTRTSYYFVGRFILPGLWGLGALAVFGNAFKSDANPELSLMAMPNYLSQILPMGLVGLIVAGMLAAEMSTDSSYLLAWGSVIYNDIICPLRSKPFSERVGLWINRILVILIGIFLLLYGLWYEIPGRAWDYLQITGEIYFSSMAVLLVCALYWKWTHAWGGYAALFLGAVGPIAFLFLSQTERFKGIPAWIPGIGSFVLAAVGMIVASYLGRRREAAMRGSQDS